MPTVIDSLILTLNLDPKDFNKGQKEAANAFLKTKDQAVSTGKQIEEASKKAADSINRITKEVLGLFAVFLGARGLKEFVADIVDADAALGRFSRNLDQSPQTISAWGAAAERMGGSANVTVTTFERIGKALYDLHRNGALLPKEFSQLQALTGKRIDTDHGIDKFLKDTASALKAMNAISPSQAHFLAQGMGIDDATANVMIKYGDAIGSYIDQLKKLAPTDDAIKASQELQDHWVTLQQTAVSLANSILTVLGPELSKLLKQMTEWVTTNQDWLRTNVVEAVKKFADYLASIDWIAVGNGIREFGSAAHTLADDLGGVLKVSEAIFALWAGAKMVGVVRNIAGLLGTGEAATTSSVADAAAAEAAAAEAGGAGILSWLMSLSPGLLGLAASQTLGGHGEVGVVSSDKVRAYLKAEAFARSKDAQPNYSSLARDRDAHGEALSGTTVDGRPVSKSNPLPIIDTKQDASPGFWGSVGNFLGGIFGSSASAAQAGSGMPAGVQRSGLTRVLSTAPALTGSNEEVVKFIKEEAVRQGVDPNVVLRVAMHEGLRGFDPTKPDHGGDGGSSFGPFQLHYGGMNPAMPHAGLGDEFTKATGLDARSSATWKEQARFAIQQVRKGGWSPWMGARAEGVYGKAGVGPMPPTGAGASALSSTANDNRVTTSSSSNEMHIGSIQVNAPNATDAQGVASGVGSALQRSNIAATANYGPM